MKMKILFPILFSCFQVYSQHAEKPAPNIAGIYNMNFSHDPQGMCKLFMLDSHKYLIAYFGGAVTGQWQMFNDSVIALTPIVQNDYFVIYGRCNKDLGDSARIFFQGFERDETFFSFGAPDGTPKMKRVFNPDPNCFSFPYVHRFKPLPNIISLAMQPKHYDDDSVRLPKIYTFENKKNYNDFIAYHFENAGEQRTSYLLFQNDTMYFEGEGKSSKDSLPMPDDHEYKEIQQLTKLDMNPKEIYCNPHFNDVSAEDVNFSDYTYNEQKGAYLKKLFYIENEEYQPMSDAFNRLTILYPLKAITTFQITTRTIEIDQIPLFHVVCTEQR
jgi:hypothetical protein